MLEALVEASEWKQRHNRRGDASKEVIATISPPHPPPHGFHSYPLATLEGKTVEGKTFFLERGEIKPGWLQP